MNNITEKDLKCLMGIDEKLYTAGDNVVSILLPYAKKLFPELFCHDNEFLVRPELVLNYRPYAGIIQRFDFRHLDDNDYYDEVLARFYYNYYAKEFILELVKEHDDCENTIYSFDDFPDRPSLMNYFSACGFTDRNSLIKLMLHNGLRFFNEDV